MTASDILKKWLEYSNYDPNQKSFKVFSAEYEFRKISDAVAKFLPYDPDANLSVLYIKNRYDKVLQNMSLKAYDVISNPQGIQEHVQMWQLLHSEEIAVIEQAALDTLDGLVSKVMKNKQIGNRDLNAEKEALLQSVASVAEALHECNVELFLRGGPIGNISHFSTHIHVFDRLADCLLTLEHSPDGMYLCFIRCGDTADGYFGFYIKSNGSILSINERINESYPGEHGNHRNGRWAEGKQYNLFPYSFVISFQGSDYKGYATSHVIDEEKLAFFNLSPDAYMPLVLAMMLLGNQYSNQSVADMPLRYADSLLPQNLPMLSADTQSLTLTGNSALVATAANLSIDMTAEGVLDARYAEDLRHSPGVPGRYQEFGEFPSGKNLMVELWGEGFQLDHDRLLNAVTGKDPIQNLLPETAGLATTKQKAEFVATERGMQIAYYKEAREQLAEHIRKQMLKAYNDIGGAPALNAWWDSQLTLYKEHIFQLCIDAYKKALQNNTKFSPEQLKSEPCHFRYLGNEKHIGVHLNVQNVYDMESTFPKLRPFNAHIRTSAGGYTGKTRCPITGTTASIYFYFRMDSYLDMKRICGKKLPKILVGYEQRGHRIYGNPILNATDAVTGVGTPFESHEYAINPLLWTGDKWRDYFFHNDIERWRQNIIPATAQKVSSVCHFDFCVGFSKRGFAKLLKESEEKEHGKM